MSEYINTEKSTTQYNGPVNSSDFNLKIEQNYQDLVQLYNRSGILDQKLKQAFERVLKDHLFMSQAIGDIEDRLNAIESSGSGEKQLSIHNYSQLDPVSMLNTDFAISSSDILSFDYIHNILTLPKIDGASHSKLKFFNNFIGQVVPNFFETKVDNVFVSVDKPGAVIDTTPVYNAVLDSSDKFWKRNVIVDNPMGLNAQTYLYIKVPTAYGGNDNSNFVALTPYPVFGVDIISVEYTSTQNPSLTPQDNWIPLNFNKLYDGVSEAIGKVPPGGWSVLGSDVILNSGPIGFYLPPVNITGLRISMRQRNYIKENGKYVYTYGLSDLDIRSDSFMPSGRTIVKFTAPEDTLIYEVTNVIPKIYNVPEELIPTAFSYRVIYKDSGVYTEENPNGSTSVWVEVTLNQLGDGTSPVLSDLIINYN